MADMFSVWEIFGIALAMSADAFCTTLSIGTAGRFRGQAFRLSFHFGLFQAMMPAFGALLGRGMVGWIQDWDHWAAFAILALVGLHMIWEAFHGRDTRQPSDRSRGWSLVSLSVATSIDALAIGVVFGVVGIPLLFPCLTIGVVAGSASLLGLFLGRRLRARFGEWLQVGGGILLLALAVKFLQI
jgi:putative Mn2+ efflux pump MntP